MQLQNDLLIGAALSWAVSGLKRWAPVRKNPKVVTALLSAAIPGGLATYQILTGVETAPLQELAQSAATQFTAAIATHETVTHTINASIMPKAAD